MSYQSYSPDHSVICTHTALSFSSLFKTTLCTKDSLYKEVHLDCSELVLDAVKSNLYILKVL